VPLVASHNSSSAEAGRHTVDYLRVIFAGAPIMFSFYALEGAFKGHGDMGRPLRALAAALLVNMVLDPVLIFWAGLEVQGAALATVIAFGVTGGLLALAARRRAWVRYFGFGLDWKIFRRVVRIGTPISLHGIVFSAVYIFIITEVNMTSGDAGTAALGLGLRVEGFGFLIGVGFASAAAAVVGQNLGAGRTDRAHEGAWLAARYAMWASGVWGLVMLLLPVGLVMLMSPDRITALYAVDYMMIVAVALPFSAVEIALQGAFSGAGDTMPPLLLGLPMTLIRIPAAMVAARVFHFGFAGIVWALTITSVVRCLMFAFWFARGRWVDAKA
jgi:putative MATE family efflux protein